MVAKPQLKLVEPRVAVTEWDDETGRFSSEALVQWERHVAAERTKRLDEIQIEDEDLELLEEELPDDPTPRDTVMQAKGPVRSPPPVPPRRLVNGEPTRSANTVPLETLRRLLEI